MDQPSPEPRTIRFGEREADLRSGEVRRQRRKVPLPDKPFRVLALPHAMHHIGAAHAVMDDLKRRGDTLSPG